MRRQSNSRSTEIVLVGETNQSVIKRSSIVVNITEDLTHVRDILENIVEHVQFPYLSNIIPMEYKACIPVERIAGIIILVRGQKVILDRDLAKLYGVETRVLKQAVRRNRDRFPEDFVFELSDEELNEWRSQFVTSISYDKMGLRYRPFVGIRP